MKSILFFIFLSVTAISQTKNNVYLFVNDSKLNSSELNNRIKLIYLENNLKLNEFKVFHFTNKNEKDTIWKCKNKKVEYKPRKIDCSFSLCEALAAHISILKTERSIFLNCDQTLDCDINKFGIEHEILNNKYESSILEKIKLEINNSKENKKSTTLFFYLDDSQNETSPKINFEKDTLYLTSNDPFKLNPFYSNNVNKIEWKPEDGLSCYDCKFPTITTNKNLTYTVTISDSLNCKKINKELHIITKNNCICNSNLVEIKDVFKSLTIPKYSYRTEPDDVSDWTISSNQSGGYVFDFITTQNCASKYKLEILDKDKKTIKQFEYQRSDVDLSSKNDYFKNHKNIFVFRMTLSDIKKYITIPDTYFYIKIISYDDKINECVPYISPTLIFAKCSK